MLLDWEVSEEMIVEGAKQEEILHYETYTGFPRSRMAIV
jgi:hypothetical protein